MLVCCFHLILGLKADRHPGCWVGLSPALSCGVRLALQVCNSTKSNGSCRGLPPQAQRSDGNNTVTQMFCVTYGTLSTDSMGFQVRSQKQLLLAGCPSSPSGFQLSCRQWWWAYRLELFPFPGPFQCCHGGCPDLQRVQLGEIRALSQASLSTLWVPGMSGLQWLRAGF